MKVPFGDLKLHYEAYKQELDAAVARVLASGYYILGPELDRFEKEFAAYLGSGYVAGCASGTEAIYLPLAALGVTTGDEVLVVAHTAVPTISAISMTGATPVFVDIDPGTYGMDPQDLERKITAKSKAIVPVHIYGQMVDMESIMKIAAKHKLPVIEDCAQSTGATYKGQQSGTIADFSCWSFYPSKNLGAFGDGGATWAKTKENHDKLLMLRNYGQSKRYHHEIIGINSRLDEIQSAILGVQLPYVDEWNVRRREIAKRYDDGLKGVVETPAKLNGAVHVYHLYVIQTDYRDELQTYLADRGVGTLIHYPIPAHRSNAYKHLGYEAGSLPNTERIAERILSLPMYPELQDAQVDAVIEAIKDFYGSKSEAKENELCQKLVPQSPATK